jgi:hypothetical protein
MNRKITLAPFAVGSDGIVYANVAHVRGDVAVMKIIREARRMRGLLFISIDVAPAEKRALRLALDNAGAEAVAKMVGSRQRQEARRGRSSSSRPQ